MRDYIREKVTADGVKLKVILIGVLVLLVILVSILSYERLSIRIQTQISGYEIPYRGNQGLVILRIQLSNGLLPFSGNLSVESNGLTNSTVFSLPPWGKLDKEVRVNVSLNPDNPSEVVILGRGIYSWSFHRTTIVSLPRLAPPIPNIFFTSDSVSLTLEYFEHINNLNFTIISMTMIHSPSLPAGNYTVYLKNSKGEQLSEIAVNLRTISTITLSLPSLRNQTYYIYITGPVTLTGLVQFD